MRLACDCSKVPFSMLISTILCGGGAASLWHSAPSVIWDISSGCGKPLTQSSQADVSQILQKNIKRPMM